MHSLRLPAAALLFALLPDSAAACTCAQPSPYAARRLEYHTVFHGRVRAIAWDDARQLRRIKFDVIKDYSLQASAADTLTVWTTQDGGMCGVDYPVGEEALIFADTGSYLPAKPAGAVYSGLCAGNARGPALAPALQALEEALGVLPARPRHGSLRRPVRIDCGQILFEGKAQANGVLRSAEGGR